MKQTNLKHTKNPQYYYFLQSTFRRNVSFGKRTFMYRLKTTFPFDINIFTERLGRDCGKYIAH